MANVTMNREVIELCIPLMSRHLGDLCWPQEPLVQTTVEQFDTLLEDRRLKNVSEETKFRAISKWLKAGFTEHDLEKGERMFTRLIAKVDLTRLSEKCLHEFLTFVRGCRELFHTGKRYE